MKALTIGGATIDTMAVVDSAHIERMSMRNAESSFLLLEEGHKTEAIEISSHCGGGAANAAVALARLGLQTAALVKLGTDERAKAILANLSAENIETHAVRYDSTAPTGASVLISSHERDAAVFTFRGANTRLSVSDLDPTAFAVDIVFVSNLSNRSAECFPEIVSRAKSGGALVAANPGIRQLAAYTEPFLKCLPAIDVLAINRAEASVLVATLARAHGERAPAVNMPDASLAPRLARRGLAGGGFELSLEAFFEALAEQGLKRVVITDGDQGAYSLEGREIIYCPAANAERIAGTAGAGDAFAATFAAYVASGALAEHALRAASLNAASVLEHVDTQTGLLTRARLEEQLATRQKPHILRWQIESNQKH